MQSFWRRILPGVRWFLLIFTLLVGIWLIDRAGRATPGDHVLAGGVALLCFAVAVAIRYRSGGAARPAPRVKGMRRLTVFYWVAAVLLLPWAVLQQMFGSYHFGAVLFHAHEGMGSHLDIWLVLPGVVSLFMTLVLMYMALTTLRRLPLSRLTIGAAGIAMLVINPLHVFLFQRAIWDRFYPVPTIYQTVHPVEVTAVPERPLNLVLVFLEGTESTYGIREQFGQIYDPLHRLGQKGRVFEEVEQVEMLGHSIAGMVAAQCGLPLVPNGLLPTKRAGTRGAFLPGHACLGDVLSEHGYATGFFVGGALDYGGIDRLYAQHGFDKIVGRDQLRSRSQRRPSDVGLPGADEVMRWGVHDSVVFEAALDQARQFEQGDAPWALVVETIGPHGPDAFLSPPCRRPGEGQTHRDILRGVECVAEVTEDFVAQLYQITSPQDTLVVVVSDHLAHRMVSAISQLRKLKRRNTAIFLGAGVPVERVAKPGSMMDIYPTILQAMGFSIAEERAGMGVSLLSPDRQSLVEQLGVTEIDRRLDRDTDLARIIWHGPEAEAGVP